MVSDDESKLKSGRRALSTRFPTPLQLVITSTLVSLGIIYLFTESFLASDPAEMKREKQLQIESSTPERAAENFLYALTSLELERARLFSEGKLRRKLLVIIRTKGAARFQDNQFPTNWWPLVNKKLRLIIQESHDLSEDMVRIIGIGESGGSADSHHYRIEFVLSEINERWYVSHMNITE